MKKKLTAVTLAMAVSVMLLAGCGGAGRTDAGGTEAERTTAAGTGTPAAETSQPGVQDAKGEAEIDEGRTVGTIDEITINVSSDIADLAPFSVTTNGRQSVLPTLYEYLAYYDPNTESGIRGILMKDFEALDGFTFRIEIYDSIYDSAGNHITAEDVAWCFNTYHELGISGLAWLVDYCKPIDDYTVELKLMSDAAGQFENVICGQVPIVSKTAYENSPDGMTEKVVSTSPYIVDRYVSGSQLVVKKNPDYWQKDDSLILDVSRANAETITFNIITESSQTAINLETGAIDIAQKISSTEASRFIDGEDADQGYHVFGTGDSNIYLLFFNMSEDSVFHDNQALRQAICYAIDTDGIVQGAAKGSAKALKAVGNPICVDYNPEWEQQDYYDYDVDKAQERMKESGYDVSKPLRIMCASTEMSQSISQIIQAYLMQIGIQTEIEVYDSALFSTYIADPTAWDMFVDTRMNNDYVTTLSSILARKGDTPAVNFCEDATLEQLAAEASGATGHSAETVEAYMQYTKEQAYVYGLMSITNYYVTNDKVADIFVNFKGLVVPGACRYYTQQ